MSLRLEVLPLERDKRSGTADSGDKPMNARLDGLPAPRSCRGATLAIRLADVICAEPGRLNAAEIERAAHRGQTDSTTYWLAMTLLLDAGYHRRGASPRIGRVWWPPAAVCAWIAREAATRGNHAESDRLLGAALAALVAGACGRRRHIGDRESTEDVHNRLR